VIIRFKFENFRSIREEQELSFVASSLKDFSDSVVPVQGFRHGLLRVASLYGANASGKTNVLRALHFVARAVRNSHRYWKPDGPIYVDTFLLEEEAQNRPTSFRLDFLLADMRYQFGLTINKTDVLREWVYCYPSGKKQIWYEREGGASRKTSFGRKLVGENRRIENMTRRNSLFLSTAAQNNHEMLTPLFNWFSERMHFVYGPRTALLQETTKRCSDVGFRNELLKFLATADLGILSMDIKEETFPEKTKDMWKELMEFVGKRFASTEEEKAVLEKAAPPQSIQRITLRHKARSGEGTSIPIEDESAGTEAFLSLLGPVLTTLESGGVLCVDELDSSLHPLLALEIVRMFKDPDSNPKGAQIIFNTHDVNLLDAKLLRRDEIWFTEKDSEGATHLYPLSDFKPRQHTNLKDGYLQGRYGAVPFVESFLSGRRKV